MRISDWSSDVCSSDLGKFQYGPAPMQVVGEIMRRKLVAKGEDGNPRHYIERRILMPLGVTVGDWRSGPDEIGRASCRGRVCQYGLDIGGRRLMKKKTKKERT